MAEEKNSTRDLLDEIEGGWETAKPPKVGPASVRTQALHAKLDAAAEELEKSLGPISSPDLDDLDGGWDDDEDEDDEADTDLPDERLDPEAYAAAKRARAERAELRRKKRRAKADAKRSKQKDKAASAQRKQKPKTKKARAATTRGASKDGPAGEEHEVGARTSDDHEQARGSAARARPAPRASARRSADKRMLTIAVAVFVVAAVVAALLATR